MLFFFSTSFLAGVLDTAFVSVLGLIVDKGFEVTDLVNSLGFTDLVSFLSLLSPKTDFGLLSIGFLAVSFNLLWFIEAGLVVFLFVVCAGCADWTGFGFKNSSISSFDLLTN